MSFDLSSRGAHPTPDLEKGFSAVAALGALDGLSRDGGGRDLLQGASHAQSLVRQRTFDFPDAMLERLKIQAERDGISQGEAVRQAVASYLSANHTPYPQPTSQHVGTPTSQPTGGHVGGDAHKPAHKPARGDTSQPTSPHVGEPRARVEESLFPTTYEKEEPKEKQGGSREGAKRSKEMPAPPAEIAAVVELWLAYKRDRGESYKSASGLTELYKKLSEWGPQRAMAAVKHSMASNWAGVFEANGGGGNGRTREPDIRRTAGAHKEPQIIVNYSRYEPPETKP